MFTCTLLRHPLPEWQKNKGVHPKISSLQLKADRLDRSKYFNCRYDSGKIETCSAVTGHKLLTSPGVADMYTLLMTTWNTLPDSYQQRVSNHILATVQRQIQQAENPTPAVVISMHTARVDNAILLDYLTSKVPLAEPEIRSTDPNIPIDNNCMDDKQHLRIRGRSGDFEDEGDESYAIPTACWWRRATTELERFDLGTRDVDRYECKDGDDTDVNEEEEASQADHGSTQNVEDRGHSRFDLGTRDVDGHESEDCDDAD